MQSDAWGPLAKLIGDWEGAEGLDVSFHNAEGRVGETKYRERATFEPFGPVDNGAQHLWGLDYRMSAWRIGEENPFHTPGDASFFLEATVGHEVHGISSNPYLANKARTTKYTCKVAIGGDTFSYDSCTTYVHHLGGEIAHTDRNTLRRVSAR